MVLILSNVGVTGTDCGVLSKIMLCKVMGITGLHKYEHYGTCPLLKVHIFLDIKHVHRPASWSESLATNHEVPGSIPGSTVGIFPEGEDSCGDHGLGGLVEFRFKDPPGTTSSYITTHINGTM
jgi:hypothetical protein